MRVDFFASESRPRYKLLSAGARALSDAELVAVLLRNGLPGKSVLSLARDLLDTFGGIAGLLYASADDLANLTALRCETRRAELIGATDVVGEDRGVDVKCFVGRSSCLFELKVVYAASQSQCLREALGQLLDYGFAPGRTRHVHHAIVLNEPLQGRFRAWLQVLCQEVFKVEVFYLENDSWKTAGLTRHPLNKLFAGQ
jgi:hypothetical protein